MSNVGTTAGIPGIGGFLQLRTNFDKTQITNKLEVQNKQRHQGYLKEKLVMKFMRKYGLNQYGNLTDKTIKQEAAIKKYVTDQYTKFIDQHAFTEKNLVAFESALVGKMKTILKGYDFKV